MVSDAELLKVALSTGLVMVTVGGTFPAAATVVDINGDGKADLAIANYNSGDVSVLLGNGDGTFQGAASYGVGAGATALASADFHLASAGAGIRLPVGGKTRLELAAANALSTNIPGIRAGGWLFQIGLSSSF